MKYYEKPIIKSRTPGCSEQALEEGKERAEEVSYIQLANYPPAEALCSLVLYPKSSSFAVPPTFWTITSRLNVSPSVRAELKLADEYVVFVAPSIHQLKAFGRILDRSLLSQVLGGDAEKQPLAYSEQDGFSCRSFC